MFMVIAPAATAFRSPQSFHPRPAVAWSADFDEEDLVFWNRHPIINKEI